MKRIKSISFLFFSGLLALAVASTAEETLISADPVPRLIEVTEDLPTQFSFTLESSSNTIVSIHPEKFTITKGSWYFIDNTSAQPHLEIMAEEAGKLFLLLPAVERAGFTVSRMESENLVFNSSFEQEGGWEFQSIPDIHSVRNSEFTLQKQPSPLPRNDQQPDRFLFSEQYSRKGKFCGMLEKNQCDSIVTVNSLPIPVEQGKRYYLTAFFYPNLFNLESAFSINVRLFVDNKFIETISHGRHWLSFPPTWSAPGQWQYYFESVKVPDHVQGNTFSVIIQLEIDGRPARIFWDDISLRLQPKLAKHPGLELDLPPINTPEEVNRNLLAMNNSYAKVIDHHGTPCLEVDGEVIPGVMFCSDNVGIGYKAVQVAKEQNINVISVLANLNHWNVKERSVWTGKDQYDFTMIETNIRNVLAFHPDAKIILRLANTYKNFADDHPESAWVTGKGETDIIAHAGVLIKKVSHISDSVRQELGKTYRLIGEFLRENPVGKSVIGIHISFGDDGQWYPDRPWSFKTFDYSEGSRKGIIGELKKMYHHDLQALRQAWGEPTLEFDQIKMPSPMELSPNQVFLWPDLPAEKRLIDCILAYHRAVITTMDLITAEFKKSIGKPTVALTYFPINCVLTQGELLRSEQMDGIVAVPGYMRKRRTGSHNESGHALGSFRLHKKIYLDEVDFRSDYGMVQNREYRRYVGASEGLDDHFHQLRRNFAFLFSQGEWGWFRTLGVKGHFNWYGMYAPILGEIQLAAKTLIEAPVSDDWGQVAVFRDDLSQAYYSFFERHDHRLHHSAISIRGLSHSGLSWNSYLLSDLENPVRPHAKINLFSTATSLSEKQIQWIENNLQKNGNILVFIGDAGRIAPGGFEKNIHRLTGMRIKAHPEILVAYKLSPDRFDDPLSTGMPGNALWFRNINGPLFLIEDPDAQPLALLSGTSFPAMSVKRHPNWTAVYLAGNSEYALTAEFLRKLATEAGIQPIGPEGDVTYCGNGFLAIHAVKPGRKEIFLKSASELTDLSTGEKVAEKTSSYSCYMNAGETRWFRIKY